MADLRVIAMILALVTAGILGGCGSADAQSTPSGQVSGMTAPAGWQDLPSVAAAARMAAGAGGVTIDGVEAWGEPAMGCYAIGIALHGSGGRVDDLTAQVLDGIAAEKIDVSEVVKPASADGVLALTLERKPYHGRLRARLGDGRITAFACVANQREPLACETACTPLIESWSRNK